MSCQRKCVDVDRTNVRRTCDWVTKELAKKDTDAMRRCLTMAVYPEGPEKYLGGTPCVQQLADTFSRGRLASVQSAATIMVLFACTHVP